MALVALRVYLQDRGPILYQQQRIGYKGSPFYIYKFRSMRTDAEKDGPKLSSDDDCRITPFGKLMRKWRLDELPQLWNIFKGDMSFVGPRPERKFFIDKISQFHPDYQLLLNERPGLTSWGMVQFGYAHNVEEMISRSRYDLEYVSRISLPFDMKVMIYTLKIILQGKGK
ncbi:sugar transferase [Niabella terrae]